MAQATESFGVARKTEMGKWHHVYAPTKGMITSIPSTILAKEASPWIKGCYLRDGEVNSDFGHTDWPTPGVLKTNALNGSVMKIDQLFLTNGNSYLLAFTTTNAYQYNTSTDTWDVVTRGILVDDCETAWTAQANVTSTRDTAVKLRGTYSAKHVIAAAFTTGIASTYDITSTDCTPYTHLSFWIYSSIATAANDLKVGVSETSALGGTPLYFNVPALSANTWTHCSVSGDFTGYNAVISVGLNVVVDNGAQTVYLDDIRAVAAFTGDEDNRFSTTVMNDAMIITNGIDQPQTYNGTTMSSLTTTLVTGSITTSEVAFTFKDHLVLCNNTENAADTPLRVTWSNIGSTTDWVNGTAGYQDLTDDESWIMGVERSNENEYIIYKERSIVKMTWVGGHTPFRFKTMISGTGLLAKDGVENLGGDHIIFGPDAIYQYDGGEEIDVIDDAIHSRLYSRLNDASDVLARSFMFYVEEDHELQLWVPITTSTTPNEVWCYDVVTKAWYVKDRGMTGYGFYKTQTALIFGTATGNFGDYTNIRFGDTITKTNFPITLTGDTSGQVFKIDKATLNNDGSAITNVFETPDFVLPDSEDYMNKFIRVEKMLVEAKGQSITAEWSDDGGGSWNPAGTSGDNSRTLGGTYDIYEFDFDVVARKVRFKFSNSTASSGFTIRYYGFYYVGRSGRR